MLESHPPRSPGLIVTVALAAGIILLDALLAWALVTQPVTLLSFGLGVLLLLSVPALILTIYLLRGLRQARYQIDQGDLIIAWPGFDERMPLATISRILWGHEVEHLRGFRGLRLPGLFLGRAEAVIDGQALPVTFRAARGPAEQVFLMTEQRLVAVSPTDPENFKACVQGLRGSGAEISAPDPTAAAAPARSLWRNRRVQALLLVPVLLNAGLFAYLSGIFPRLPDVVPLRFGAGGEILRTGASLQLFFIPLLALFGWLLNGGLGWYFFRWRNAPATAYLLWTASGGLQVAAWIGLVSLARV
jgi:hypothetical protein